MPQYRPKPRQRYHHGNLRDELVAAAVAILESEGVAALTLRAVAKRLRVSQTAPYRHFASKELLLVAVATEGFDSLLTAIHRRLAELGNDPVARYVTIGVVYLDFALTHRAHFRVMYASRPLEFGTGPVADAGRTAFRLFSDCIVDCQRAGLARSGNAAAIAVQAWAYVYGLIGLYLEGLLPRSMGEDAVTELVRGMTLFLGESARGQAREPSAQP
jgi:AcrR family transcriptional regulator